MPVIITDEGLISNYAVRRFNAFLMTDDGGEVELVLASVGGGLEGKNGEGVWAGMMAIIDFFGRGCRSLSERHLPHPEASRCLSLITVAGSPQQCLCDL